MNGTVGVVAFIVTLTGMILFHEFGHFLAAKRFGFKVEEFFLGFGPRIFSRKRGETEYGVKAILLGGYVRIAGMNPWQTVPESELPRTYGAKPAWQRAILLSAGSASHLVLAAALLFVVFGIVGEQQATTTLDVVQERLEGAPSPAAEAGLMPGDRVLGVQGEEVRSWDEVRAEIRRRPGLETEVLIEREGRRLTLGLLPASVVERTETGGERTVGVIGVSPELTSERLAPHIALWSAVETTGELVGWSVIAIGKVFSPEGLRTIFEALGERGERGLDQPVGLVGGARLAGQTAAAGEFQSLIGLLVGFIVFVGVINLAPLPPLDGGHLLVLAIEKLRGRRVDMRKVIPVAVAVLSFFAFLFFSLLYLDIFRPIANPFQ